MRRFRATSDLNVGTVFISQPRLEYEVEERFGKADYSLTHGFRFKFCVMGDFGKCGFLRGCASEPVDILLNISYIPHTVTLLKNSNTHPLTTGRSGKEPPWNRYELFKADNNQRQERPMRRAHKEQCNRIRGLQILEFVPGSSKFGALLDPISEFTTGI